MAGAVGVHATLLALLARAGGGRGARLLPPRNNRDRSATDRRRRAVRVGWGLSGYCPGPAIASLGFGAPTAFVFVAAMIVGIIAAGLFAPTLRLRIDRCLMGTGSVRRLGGPACGKAMGAAK